MGIYSFTNYSANDVPLDSFHKYLMYPEFYEEEYRKENEDKN